ncbi:MAG: DUF2723 domain-containing protein [Cytophagales bacterium]|nr:DUF2723 domain-containing protein [Cytophagales bacterium]
MTYQKINNISGWVAFFIAMVVYTLTVEPTASFWDCGEFIACSYKLEVPHPPGAPFFLLTGRMFSMLAMGDTTQVAYWVNMLSVLCSAFAILFLYWSISHLAGRILKVERGNETSVQQILMVGAGMVGALTCTFSDSFWFSAVEAEVYGMSSFFTAFVFWAILKWENKENESDRSRWLILIAYMMGLSIGVHLLNLVTIPVLGLIVYFRYKPEITSWGVISTLLVSGGIILLIMIGIIPGLPSIAGGIEIFFVNTLKLPFGSGVIFFGLVFIGTLTYGIRYSITRGKHILNTALLCFTFIMIGYSSYAIVLIRSNYDPPIDENNPEEIISFVSYLKREQYGSRPLFKGQYFTARVEDQKKGAAIYMRGEDSYEVKDYKVEYVYEPGHSTILPRMYSSDRNHIKRYMDITGLRQGEKPTFSDNLYFMFKYQIGHMYMRYFMWNFAGRASDVQGAESVFFSPDNNAPDQIKTNKGRNIYFALPLLLGLLGMMIQYRNNPKYFSVTLLLFFLTGIALVLYLNSPPTEPRERDYIYTGSYYVFAIWVGFGVIALYEILKKIISSRLAAILACVLALGIPTIMASENWDDHDRSDRLFSMAAAKNYLDSCAPNAILFTGGDNDTFPLWYLQEVEGYRTDVRVIVLSYFNTDWYVQQMMRPSYESEPLPFGLTEKNYQQGGLNDYLPVIENPQLKDQAINLRKYLELIKQDHEALRVPTSISAYNSVPTKALVLSNIDTAKIKALLPDYLDEAVTNHMILNIKGNGLEKKDLAILDLIANNNWDRPMYFNYTSLSHFNVDVSANIIQEGICYRLLPIASNRPMVNKELMYKNMMEKFSWVNLDRPDVYYSEDYRGFCQNLRSAFNTLAQEYMAVEDYDTARSVLLKCLEAIPNETIPYDYFSTLQVGMLLEVGERELAIDIAQKSSVHAVQTLDRMAETGSQDGVETQRQIIIINELARAFRAADEKELAAEYEGLFDKYYKR